MEVIGLDRFKLQHHFTFRIKLSFEPKLGLKLHLMRKNGVASCLSTPNTSHRMKMTDCPSETLRLTEAD